MALTKDQLDAIKTALGDEGADMYASIETAAGEAKTAIDTAKGEATKAKREAAAASKALTQAQSDLETAKAGESDQLATLIAERDAAKAEADANASKHRDYRIKMKLSEALDLPDKKRLKSALKAFDMPEGADINEDGELTGVDEAIKAFKESDGYFWAPVDGAPKGTANRRGSDPAPSNDSGDKGEKNWGQILDLPTAKAKA